MREEKCVVDVLVRTVIRYEYMGRENTVEVLGGNAPVEEALFLIETDSQTGQFINIIVAIFFTSNYAIWSPPGQRSSRRIALANQ